MNIIKKLIIITSCASILSSTINMQAMHRHPEFDNDHTLFDESAMVDETVTANQDTMMDEDTKAHESSMIDESRAVESAEPTHQHQSDNTLIPTRSGLFARPGNSRTTKKQSRKTQSAPTTEAQAQALPSFQLEKTEFPRGSLYAAAATTMHHMAHTNNDVDPLSMQAAYLESSVKELMSESSELQNSASSFHEAGQTAITISNPEWALAVQHEAATAAAMSTRISENNIFFNLQRFALMQSPTSPGLAFTESPISPVRAQNFAFPTERLALATTNTAPYQTTAAVTAATTETDTRPADTRAMVIDTHADENESDNDDDASSEDDINSPATQVHHKKRKKPTQAATLKTPLRQMEEIATVLAQQLKHELKAPHKHTGKNCCLAESDHYKSCKQAGITTAKKKNKKAPGDFNNFWRAMLNIREKLSKAVRTKNHLVVRELAQDPVVRACWHLVQNKEKLNLLSIAAQNSDFETAQILVENGFNVNSPNHSTRSESFPLDIALQADNYAMIQYLVDQGASLDNPERLYDSAIDVYNPNHNALDWLINNNVTCVRPTLREALRNALKSNHTRLIQLTIEKHVPLNKIPAFIKQNNLLNTAITQANSDLFEWLLSFFLENNLTVPPMNVAKALIEGYSHRSNHQHDYFSNETTQHTPPLISMVYSLIKNGIGTSDDYKNVIEEINTSIQLHINRMQASIDIASRFANAEDTAKINRRLVYWNHELQRAVNAGIQERYKKIASTKTLPEEGTDLFDMPALCAVIGEYEAACDYQGEGSLAHYAQQNSAEIMAQKYPEEKSTQQKDSLQEYWNNNWQDLLKMLDNDPSIPFAQSEHQNGAEPAYATHNSASSSRVNNTRTNNTHEAADVMQNAASTAAADTETEYICCARYPDCACAHPAPAKKQKRK